MERVKIVSDILATWVAIVAAITSGWFALWEYHSNSRADRVKTTIGFSDVFRSDSYMPARAALSQYGAQHANELFAKSAMGDEHLSLYVIDTINKEGLAKDISVVIGFFDELHACSCGKACDTELSVRLFGRDSRLFFANFYPYIAQQRIKLRNNEYGLGVEYFAKSYGGKYGACN